jgi:hypothetical protein
MDDRIYQDPFDLDFPDIVEEVQLDEGPINAIKQKVAAAEAKKEANTRLKAWIAQSFNLQSERFGASTPTDTKKFSEGLAIYWDRYVIAYCADPFVEKPKISFEEFKTFEDAMKRAENLATEISNRDVVKKIPKYILTKEKGAGGRIPLFVCVDHSKLKDLLVKPVGELSETIRETVAKVRMAFGKEDNGVSYKLTTICPSAVNLGHFANWEGKEGLNNLLCLVYYAIGDNFGNGTVQATSPRGLENFDVKELLGKELFEKFKKLEEHPDSSVESEEPKGSAEEPAEPVVPAAESKTDRFETKEFKSELRELGFTDAQIEKLYKSGALQALAAINLDDIDEGE